MEQVPATLNDLEKLIDKLIKQYYTFFSAHIQQQDQPSELLSQKISFTLVIYSSLEEEDEFKIVFDGYKKLCTANKFDTLKESEIIEHIESILKKQIYITALTFILEILIEIAPLRQKFLLINTNEAKEEEATKLEDQLDVLYKKFMNYFPQLVEKDQPDYFKLCFYVYRCHPYDLAFHKIELLACSEQERRSKLQTDYLKVMEEERHTNKRSIAEIKNIQFDSFNEFYIEFAKYFYALYPWLDTNGLRGDYVYVITMRKLYLQEIEEENQQEKNEQLKKQQEEDALEKENQQIAKTKAEKNKKKKRKAKGDKKATEEMK